jgi:acyl-coenzyme A thioesterase PaaI-like protein
MTQEYPVDPQAYALANELREIAAILADRDVTSEAAAAALPLARELRAHIEAPRRQRWYELDPDAPTLGEARRSYLDLSPLRGRLNPIAPPMVFERIETPEGLRLLGHVRLSKAYEGPPHGVHGGIVAALFDEILGGAQNLAPPVGVTAKLTVRYRHVTPIEEDLRFEAWIHDRRERRVEVRATCHAGETLTADAVGLFVRVDFGEVQQRMARRRDGGDERGGQNG